MIKPIYNPAIKHHTINGQSLTYVLEYIKQFKNYVDFELIALSVAQKRGITIEDVKAELLAKTELGKVKHKYVEDLLKGNRQPDGSDTVIEEWYSDFFLSGRYKFINSEQFVYSETLMLAGRYDVLAEDSDKKKVLIDIKTGSLNFYSDQCLKAPFQHLKDCTGIHAFLQLYLYENLVEGDTRSEVVHITDSGYKVYENIINKEVFIKNWKS